MPEFYGRFENKPEGRVLVTALGEYHNIPNLLQKWAFDCSVGYYTAEFLATDLPMMNIHQREGTVVTDIYGNIVHIQLTNC